MELSESIEGPWRGSEDSPCLTWGLMGSGVSTVSPGHDGDVSCFFLVEFDYLRINMWGSVGEITTCDRFDIEGEEKGVRARRRDRHTGAEP